MITIQQLEQPGISYLDMQAYVGVTKHNGGFAATKDLLSLCHIETAKAILDVGCGIARRFRSHPAQRRSRPNPGRLGKRTPLSSILTR